MLVGSAVYLAAALGGAAVGGAVGAAWGSAAGTSAAAGVWWWELHRAIGDAETEPDDGQSSRYTRSSQISRQYG